MRVFRLLSHLALSALLVLTVSAKAFSQTRAKVQRVQFDRGQTGALLTGATPKRDEGDFDQYLLGARQHQRLSVHLNTGDAKAYLIIYAVDMSPPEDCLSCGRGGFSRHTKLPPHVRDWSGQLPVNGDYSLQVYTESQGGISYTLSVSIR
jgi:hypothetical protein